MKGAATRIIGIVIAAVIIGVIAIFLLSGNIEETHIEWFTLTGISSIETDSFTIDGVLAVQNPSNLIVPISSIEYDVFLKETGERIGSGELPSFTLETGLTEIPFEQRVEWQPTTEAATELLVDQKVTVQVNGTIYIGLEDKNTLSLDFHDETGIADYVTQHAAAEQLAVLQEQYIAEQQAAESFESTLVENIPGRLN